MLFSHSKQNNDFTDSVWLNFEETQQIWEAPHKFIHRSGHANRITSKWRKRHFELGILNWWHIATIHHSGISC